MQAAFRQGAPLMADYTPGSATDAGAVVVVGAVPVVTHRAIAANEQGAVGVGGGIYEMTGDAAITAGKKVWWNAAAGKVTETASTHKVFGFVAPGSSCSGDGATCLVVHAPEI